MRNAVMLFLAGVSCIVLLSGTGSAADVPTRRPMIVCSTTQIADFARQVVGDRCEVTSILAPGADPHTYMPTPQDAKTVLSADIAMRNGLHLEGKSWMATLARDANVDGVILQKIVFCDNHAVESTMLAEELEPKGIPTLILEREYMLSDIGRLKTRIEAFMERVAKR